MMGLLRLTDTPKARASMMQWANLNYVRLLLVLIAWLARPAGVLTIRLPMGGLVTPRCSTMRRVGQRSRSHQFSISPASVPSRSVTLSLTTSSGIFRARVLRQLRCEEKRHSLLDAFLYLLTGTFTC